MLTDDLLSRVFYRERWRARRGLVPLRIKETARWLGQCVGRASVRTAWRLSRWWVRLPRRPVSELDTLWTDVRWSRRRAA